MLKEIFKKLEMKRIAIICGIIPVIAVGSVIGINQALNEKESSYETGNSTDSLAMEDVLDENETDVPKGEDTSSQEIIVETETEEEAKVETNEIISEVTSEAVGGTISEQAQQSSATTVSDSVSGNHSKPVNKTPSGSSTTPATPSTSTSTTTNQTYEKFPNSIGVYENKNLPSESDYYEEQCPAWIGVYSVGKNETVNNEIKEKFQETFGYYANSEVACTYVGKYAVDGYEDAQDIYQYTIKDLTYPLLQDEFYVIKKKICDDGSPWVGFPVPGSLETMESSARVQQLVSEMRQLFYEWSGYSREYVLSNSDKFIWNGHSEAGWMRTTDGKVVQVVYRYIRGLNMPILEQ